MEETFEIFENSNFRFGLIVEKISMGIINELLRFYWDECYRGYIETCTQELPALRKR